MTCEHASAALPPGLDRAGLDPRLMDTHWALDLGAWDLTRLLSRSLRATAVGGRYSRLVADLNRDPSDPTFTRIRAGEWQVGFNEEMGVATRRRRASLYHAPYHEEIDRQLRRRLAAGVAPFLLAIHSFTPELNGRRRPYDAGVLYSEHRNLARRLARRIRAGGLDCALNRPYSGLRGFVYSVERHGRRHRVPYLELEVNQARLGSPSRCLAAAARIGPAVLEFLESL